MTRFFIDTGHNIGEIVTISGENFDHLKVLRPRVGEVIELCNPAMQVVYHAEIEIISRRDAQVNVVGQTSVDSEPAVNITLFQGVPKGDKMELIIQKCVELGVSKIVPIITARTVSHPANAAQKQQRWQKIAHAAAQQSRRGIIPDIGDIITFQEALGELANFDSAFVAYECEAGLKASEAFKAAKGRNIALFIGPEGGFEPCEIQELCAGGAKSVSLGKRILRTETAAFAATIILLSAQGEF
ncbi:MAG: 16S rRNA (uracil(1498)-N(3))-methyltransferase [Defluviitaleaceae bacterium]|nr:16S rRNA (uracil(1498)-N(3))-methyltransferase [Defluviitaleaceae bacterium]